MNSDKKKPHVLFVSEKWRDARPGSPTTVVEHHLFETLQSSELATFSKLHFDEYYWEHKVSCDQELIRRVATEQPDLVVLCFIPWFQHIPSVNVVSTISTTTKCVTVWPDAAVTSHMAMAEAYAPYVEMSILWDIDVSWRPNSKFVHLWTPQNQKIFNDPGLYRDINVSFVGSSHYVERKNYLSRLVDSGVNVYIAGGNFNQGIPGAPPQGCMQQPMPAEDYANILQRSKISLNFCLNGSGYGEQLKGRIFESMFCGTLLMESRYSKNWIDRWFVKDVHYVSFSDENELLEKVKHYINTDQERKTIADNGKRRCEEWYNSLAWWQYVFKECGVEA
jgi:hypothetical protein